MQKLVNFKEANKRKYPEPVVLLIAKDNEKYNPVPIGWYMFTSSEPAMISLSLANTRYSLKLIQKQKEFVISFPLENMQETFLYYGKNSGEKIDKFKERPLAVSPASKIDGVILKDAVLNFECKLESHLQTGDHVICVGKIVACHTNEDESLKRLYSIGSGHILGGVEIKS